MLPCFWYESGRILALFATGRQGLCHWCSRCPEAGREMYFCFWKRKRPIPEESAFFFKSGAPGEIRTPYPLVRSQVLYPDELRALFCCFFLRCISEEAAFYTAFVTFASFFETFFKLGGDGGIRTLDTSFSPYAPLAGECLRPLGHVSEGRHINGFAGPGQTSLQTSLQPVVLKRFIPGPDRKSCAGCARPVPGIFRR